MSGREVSRSHSRSDSRHGSRSRKSRSRSKRRHSRSRSRGKKHSRSRSHSHGRSRSRSQSYDRRRSARNDRNGGRYGYYRSRSRSPMSGRRRHMGDREHPITSRCLGVFGLSLYTQERDLRDIFARYGPIDDLQIVYDHQTGRSRGFAFIYYKHVEDAVEAKETLPGTEIDGRRIRVDYSITERAHTPTPGVYLGRPAPGYRNSRRSSRSPEKRRHSRSYSRSRSHSPRRY